MMKNKYQTAIVSININNQFLQMLEVKDESVQYRQIEFKECVFL